MKKNLKTSLSFIIPIVLGFGCKKSVTEPFASNNHSSVETQAVKVPITGFQVNKNDSKVGLSGSPHLNIKNVPAATKQFVVIMDGLDKSKTPKSIWIATASSDLKQIDALGFGLPQDQISAGLVKIVKPFYLPTGLKSYEIEVFSLSRELSTVDLDGIKNITRDKFKLYCQQNNIVILGSSIAVDLKKSIENDIKRISGEVNKKQIAVLRAEIDKQKAEELWASGKVTGKVSAKERLKLTETKLDQVKKELAASQKELSAAQKSLTEI